MPLSMQHWNGHQMCAIDIETLGTNPMIHDMVQIAILPLDSNCEPRKDVLPFYIDIVPQNPHIFEKEAIALSKDKLARIQVRGFDPERAADLLEEWIDKLALPFTRTGLQKRIIPLGHNYGAFDKGFIQRWLGPVRYSEWFDGRYVDTMVIANYLNDRAAMHGNVVPFSKVNLQWVAHTLRVEQHRAHDALMDCKTTAGVYRELLKQGLLA